MSTLTAKEAKALGLCIRCRKPIDREGVFCRSCCDIQNQAAREARLFYKQLGFCTVCHKNRIYGNESRCPECKAKNAESQKKRRSRLKNDPEWVMAQRQAQKLWRRKRKEEGRCPSCGRKISELFINQTTGKRFLRCRICLEKNGTTVSHIIQGLSLTYENGAEIGTSFLTNMDEYCVRSVPDLQEQLKAANNENLKAIKKQVPKYNYPPEVLTATAVGYMSNHGVEFKVKKEDCYFVREIESQKAQRKQIFGGGFLLSERAAAERAAAERAAAERAAAERAAATVWELSPKEWEIVKSLGCDLLAKEEGKE